MRRMRFLFSALLCLMTVSGVYAAQPKAELRSFWLATVWQLDWPDSDGTSAAVAEKQKREMIEMLDRLEAANFNAVYFQVRSMCDAMYNSKYEPYSANLVGTRGAKPTYDPLAFVVEECHKRGIECHAWINPMRFSTGSNWTTANDNDMRNRGWLLKHGSTTIMNPALPDVRQRIVDVCKDILDNYDVDGIVFDDYFYPSGIPTTSEAGDYQQWKSSGTANFGDWRRENVNKMVEAVYNMVQSTKPFVKFGVSPRGIAATSQSVADKYGVPRCTTGSDSQYSQIFCDPLAWLKAGTIDYISPQIYWARGFSSGDFSILCPWWANVAEKFGRHFYTSHSLEYFKNAGKSPTSREKTFEGMAAQVQMNRDETLNDAPGAVFYSYSCVDDDKEKENGVDFFSYLKEAKFSAKALTPCISWKNAQEQGTVGEVKIENNSLTWNRVENVRYAVYILPAGTAHEKSSLKAEYLKAHIYNNVYALPSGFKSGEVAVTIVDRYGNEYAPSWLSAGSGDGGVDSAVADAVRVAYSGGRIVLSLPVDAVSAFDIAGRLIAEGANCSSLDLAGFSGVVLVKVVAAGGESQVAKLNIK